jgi:hypothetical protein
MYDVREVQGDKFAGGFHADEWARQDIRFKPCERTTSENYLAALPLLLSGRVRLIDNVVLRQQFAGLERRVHVGTRESVTHAASYSAHDDVACAAAGALVMAGARKGYDPDAWDRAWGDGPQPAKYEQPTTMSHPFGNMKYIS